MTATATWILKDRTSQKVLWSKEGMAPPEIVVDDSTYKNVFAASFPDVTITWGPGSMDMHLVSPDAVYKVGSVSVFSMTEVTYGLKTGAAPSTGDVDCSARVVDNAQEEAHRVLGSHGLPPGLKLEEGIPQPVVNKQPLAGERMTPTPVASMPQALHIPVSADTPTFITMMLNVKAKLLKADCQWGTRLEALPGSVMKHVEQATEGLLVDEETPWRGVFTKGMSQNNTVLDYDPFLVDETDYKTRSYINWMKGFMYIERALAQDREPDYEFLFRLSLEMFEDATMLYLVESGWRYTEDKAQPWGTVLTDVVSMMTATVQFLHNKDAEYGQPTRRQGVHGVITRLWDKIARYTNLKATPRLLPKFESMADSAKDLGGYSAILAGLLQECLEEQNPNSPWCNTFLMEKTK